ncbi:MAG: 50S ribosomal protein L11 methyltransferase [Deltaproteobacteria bacterium]|jgi:ribosomal protein L11 methyltransferase|nr:50S ribosomal protein L11 methyltransferase [Deltaproteobacteria bacterium]
MEDWLSLTIAAPPVAGEAVGAALFEAGDSGIWEDLPDSEGRLIYRAGFPLGQESRLMAEIPAALTLIAENLAIQLTEFAVILEIKPWEDFSETWKKGLSPFAIGQKLWIVPSWSEEPVKAGPGAKVLRIDPGPAFGSGRHPSTFLCLTLIHDLAGQAAPARVLDLGAGSGVLALAASLLFPAAKVEGLDNDRDTLAVAEGNRKANGLEEGQVAFSDAPLSRLNPGYDLIVANLTLNALTELAPEIQALLAPEGQLIVSGLLAEQVPAIEAVFKGLGLGVLRHLGQAEWSALLLSPKGSGADRALIGEPEA